MEAPKDKRTKAYKDWKANFDKQNSTGLGDVVEKITKATGIKKVVDTFTPDGKDCGCDKRKEELNKIRLSFPVKRCLTEQQYNQWTEFISRERKTDVTAKHQREIIIPIFASLFANNPEYFIKQQKKSNCVPCVNGWIDKINMVYEKY